MWISSTVFSWFQISQETFTTLKTEVAALRAERDALLRENITTKANFDWLRIKCNQLELERAQLLKRAYNVDVAVPEIVRTPSKQPELNVSLFEDMGDDAAKTLGLPIYGNYGEGN